MSYIYFDGQYFKKDEFYNYVKNKIALKDNLDYKDKDGKTLLMVASLYSCERYHLEIVKTLINAGVNLNIQDNYGWSALMLASRYSNEKSSLETVKTLIDAGANIELQTNEGVTALMIASGSSNNGSSLETVKILIDAGANLDIKTEEGYTALMLASSVSNKISSLETVKILIDAGANLDMQNKKGYSALMLAVESSNNESSLETVKTLIGAGANLNLRRTSDNGPTGVILASMSLHTNNTTIDTVKILMDAGADMDVKDYVGDTCLSYMVRLTKSLDIIKEVVEKGVSVDHLTTCSSLGEPFASRLADKNNFGNSLLHWCAIGIKEGRSSYQILSYLETLNIDKSLKNQCGKTYHDYLYKVDYYISKQCNICYEENEYFTMLNCACKCCKFCLDCSKKIDICCYCKEKIDGFKVIKFI
jgi:ankyrin repeat protein